MTQNNVGIAWSYVPRGDRDENLRPAIDCYEAALRVYTETDFPQEWAMTQNNLGALHGATCRAETVARTSAAPSTATRRRCRGLYQSRTSLRTGRRRRRTTWALHGTMCRAETGGESAPRLRLLRAALRVYTEQDFRQESGRPSRDRGENLSRAINCYEAALRVLTWQELLRQNTKSC